MFNDRCDTLIQSFLFIEEQYFNENALAEGFHSVFENDEYHFTQIFIKRFILNDYFRIRATTNLIKFNPQHNFIQHLIIIYKNEYNLRIMNFDINALRWYRRIVYTNSYV